MDRIDLFIAIFFIVAIVGLVGLGVLDVLTPDTTRVIIEHR